MATHEPEDTGSLDLTCPACGWTGKGDAADSQPNDVIRCPHCTEPLERVSEDR